MLQISDQYPMEFEEERKILLERLDAMNNMVVGANSDKNEAQAKLVAAGIALNN